MSWFYNIIEKTIYNVGYVLQKWHLNVILKYTWKNNYLRNFPLEGSFDSLSISPAIFPLECDIEEYLFIFLLGREKPRHLILDHHWDKFFRQTSAFSFSGLSHTKGMDFCIIFCPSIWFCISEMMKLYVCCLNTYLIIIIQLKTWIQILASW